MAITVTPYGEERWAIIGDSHLRFIDARAEALMLAALAVIKPSGVILNGDTLDMTGVSTHSKDPAAVDTVQEECDAFVGYVRRIKAATGAVRIVATKGNHEDRLERYLRNVAPALFSLRALTIPVLLSFDELGVEWQPDRLLLARGHLAVHHGSRVRNFSAYSARAELEKLRFATSSITGHTHRLGMVNTTLPISRDVVGAWEGGTLQDPQTCHVPDPDWQQGFLVVNVERDAFDVDIVEFRGHCRTRWCVWRGQRVTVT